MREMRNCKAFQAPSMSRMTNESTILKVCSTRHCLRMATSQQWKSIGRKYWTNISNWITKMMRLDPCWNSWSNASISMVLKAVELTEERAFSTVSPWNSRFYFQSALKFYCNDKSTNFSHEGFIVLELASIFSKFRSNKMTLNSMDFFLKKGELRPMWKSRPSKQLTNIDNYK